MIKYVMLSTKECVITNLGRYKDEEYTIGAFSILETLHSSGKSASYYSNLTKDLELLSEAKYRKLIHEQESALLDPILQDLVSAISHDTLFMGFSLVNDNLYASLYYAKKIKEKFSDIIIGFGGAYFSGMAFEYFTPESYPWIDFYTRGRSDELIKSIAEVNFDLGLLKDTPGLNLNIQGRWFLNDYIIEHDKFKPMAYFRDEDDQTELVTSFSIGCPYRCSFCTQHFHYPNFILAPVHECIELLKGYKNKKVSFSDALINSRTRWLKELCSEIIKNDLNILWQSWFRFGKHMNDEELLELLYDSGCRSINFGLESASSSVLKHMRKFHNEKVLYETFSKIRSLRATGKNITIKLNILVGYPNETEEDFQKTMKFILFNSDLISQVGVNAVIVDPKLDVFNKMINKNELTYKSAHDWTTEASNPQSRSERLNEMEVLLRKCRIPFNIEGHDGLNEVLGKVAV